MKRYLILRPGAIGDAIVTLPTVQRLRAQEAETEVHLVVGAAAATLLAGRCAAKAVESYELPRWSGLFTPEMPAELRSFLQGWEAILLYLPGHAAVAQRVAAACDARVIAWPPLPPAGTRVAMAWHLQGALAELGLAPRADLPRVTLLAEDVAFAERYWQEHSLPCRAGTPVIALHPGSGSARKNWPAARYAALATHLHQRYGAHILAVAGPADEAVVQDMRHTWRNAPLTLAQNLTLPEVAALLARCHCFIGNDSGIAHLAAALGVPTVALFGPTDPALWAPAGPAVRIVSAPLAEITVAEVQAATAALLYNAAAPV